MAKGNQGADWLSTEEQIRNPYFGDKMMKCGTVKLELN
jgi:Cu(I)/Ag(I) efflux system membrane fusion protein